MEKVVLAGSRPVLEVTSGSFDPPPAGMFEGLAESKGAIERVLRSTGRIDLSGPPSTPTVGTGVLVGGDLLITTRRVAATFSEGIGRRNLRIQAGFSASVVFQAEGPEGERRSEV